MLSIFKLNIIEFSGQFFYRGERHRSREVKSNFTAYEAFEYVLMRSAWCIGRSYSDGTLLGEINLLLRDAAYQKRIIVFGRFVDKTQAVRESPLGPIPASFWATGEFNYAACLEPWLGVPGVQQIGPNGTIQYRDVKFDRYQVLATWKRASLRARFFDKQRQSRARYLEEAKPRIRSPRRACA